MACSLTRSLEDYSFQGNAVSLSVILLAIIEPPELTIHFRSGIHISSKTMVNSSRVTLKCSSATQTILPVKTRTYMQPLWSFSAMIHERPGRRIFPFISIRIVNSISVNNSPGHLTLRYSMTNPSLPCHFDKQANKARVHFHK